MTINKAAICHARQIYERLTSELIFVHVIFRDQKTIRDHSPTPDRLAPRYTLANHCMLAVNFFVHYVEKLYMSQLVMLCINDL